mmetsp:Transcript_48192/g.103209  ORF Transcript_48192/g.103209 Transcript_48192/m.103209 type:complete len:92 (-) Transcript_48192:6-281(-)
MSQTQREAATSVITASFVLKIFSAEQVHRVLVGPQTSYHSVLGVVENLVPDFSRPTLLFSNSESVATLLTKATFADFVKPALVEQQQQQQQ